MIHLWSHLSRFRTETLTVNAQQNEQDIAGVVGRRYVLLRHLRVKHPSDVIPGLCRAPRCCFTVTVKRITVTEREEFHDFLEA